MTKPARPPLDLREALTRNRITTWSGLIDGQCQIFSFVPFVYSAIHSTHQRYRHDTLPYQNVDKFLLYCLLRQQQSLMKNSDQTLQGNIVRQTLYLPKRTSNTSISWRITDTEDRYWLPDCARCLCFDGQSTYPRVTVQQLFIEQIELCSFAIFSRTASDRKSPYHRLLTSRNVT